jgi:hypothetical protein
MGHYIRVAKEIKYVDKCKTLHCHKYHQKSLKSYLKIWIVVDGLEEVVKDLVQAVSNGLLQHSRPLEFEFGDGVRQGGHYHKLGGLSHGLEAVPQGCLSGCLAQSEPANLLESLATAFQALTTLESAKNSKATIVLEKY